MSEFEPQNPIEDLASEIPPKLADGPDIESIQLYEGEPQRSVLAFKEYVRMGKGRSLKRLAEQLSSEDNEWTDNFQSVFDMLKKYSSKYRWQERLRLIITKASAEVLAAAQKDALLHAKERIRYARDAQKYGMMIIEKAQLEQLTAEEARKMLKPAATLLQMGLTSERAETGESLATIKPEKPIREMSDEELDTYADTLLRAIN